MGVTSYNLIFLKEASHLWSPNVWNFFLQHFPGMFFSSNHFPYRGNINTTTWYRWFFFLDEIFKLSVCWFNVVIQLFLHLFPLSLIKWILFLPLWYLDSVYWMLHNINLYWCNTGLVIVSDRVLLPPFLSTSFCLDGQSAPNDFRKFRNIVLNADLI